MAMQPIDLQTLFVRLSQIGRDQAAHQESIAQNQDVTGREIAQRSQRSSETVNESSDVSDGPETLDEDGSNANAGERRRSQARTPEPEESDPESVFEDPDLGRNLDVEG